MWTVVSIYTVMPGQIQTVDKYKSLSGGKVVRKSARFLSSSTLVEPGVLKTSDVGKSVCCMPSSTLHVNVSATDADLYRHLPSYFEHA